MSKLITIVVDDISTEQFDELAISVSDIIGGINNSTVRLHSDILSDNNISEILDIIEHGNGIYYNIEE